MTTTSFPVGSQVQITGTFTNLLTNALADPTTVTLYVLAPASSPGQGAPAAYTTSSGVTKTSTGIYVFQLTLNVPGEWWYGWVGSGAVVAAEADQLITVTPSQLH